MGANNIRIEFGGVAEAVSTFKSILDSAKLEDIKADPFNPLMNFGIATSLSVLPQVGAAGADRGKTMIDLTSQTIELEQSTDAAEAGVCASLSISNFANSGKTSLSVNSSETGINNMGTDLTVTVDTDANDFENIYKIIDEKSSIAIMTTLKDMKKEELKQYLTELEFAPDLKEKLLAAPNLSDDVKQKIMNLEPQVIQTGLRNILENQNPATDLTQEILYDFEEAALSNINDQVADQEVSDLSEYVESLLASANVQDRLSNIYNGVDEHATERTKQLFKTVIDTLSNKTEISATDLLSVRDYAEPITDCITNVENSLSHTLVASRLTGTAVSALLNQSSMKGE